MQYPHLDDNFVRWHDGDMGEAEELEMLQVLIDTGHIHILGGAIEKQAIGLMNAGKLRCAS